MSRHFFSCHWRGDAHAPRQGSMWEPTNTTAHQKTHPQDDSCMGGTELEWPQRRSCRMPAAPTTLRVGPGSWLRAWGVIRVKPSVCHGIVVGTPLVYNQRDEPESPFQRQGLDLPPAKMGMSPWGWPWAGPAAAQGLVDAADKSGNLKCSDWKQQPERFSTGIWTGSLKVLFQPSGTLHHGREQWDQRRSLNVETKMEDQRLSDGILLLTAPLLRIPRRTQSGSAEGQGDVRHPSVGHLTQHIACRKRERTFQHQ